MSSIFSRKTPPKSCFFPMKTVVFLGFQVQKYLPAKVDCIHSTGARFWCRYVVVRELLGSSFFHRLWSEMSQAFWWGLNLLMEEILHHLACIKPCKWWDKLPITWCRISSINSTWWFQCFLIVFSIIYIYWGKLSTLKHTFSNGLNLPAK